MSSSLRLNANKQDFLKSISNHNDIFLFLSYSFEIETKDTFIHSRNFVENHIQFQIKMGKVYTRFQTKTGQKPYPLWRHIPMRLI